MTRRQTHARSVSTVLIALAVAGGLAACSTPATPAKESAADIGASAFEWDVAYATCMRGQGIDFPDPEPGGGGLAQSKVADPAKSKAAHAACEAEVRAERGDRPITEERRREMDGWNKDAEKAVDCLRKKGYEIETFDGGWRPSGTTRITDADVQACSTVDPGKKIEAGE